MGSVRHIAGRSGAGAARLRPARGAWALACAKRLNAGRAVLLLAAAAVLAGACGRGMAPVEERVSTGAGGSQPASGAARASAGSEAAGSDWTAKVRPLGETGSTASRALPSAIPPAEPVPTPPPAAAGGAARASAPEALTPGMPSAAGVNPAVVSLLNTASAQSRAGDQARAAATLERAIAIEPNNAWLWHRLADTRAKEGRLDQAVELAAKSNALATADRALQAQNWRLIAEVRRRQGDMGAAAAAEAQAAALAN